LKARISSLTGGVLSPTRKEEERRAVDLKRDGERKSIWSMDLPRAFFWPMGADDSERCRSLSFSSPDATQDQPI